MSHTRVKTIYHQEGGWGSTEEVELYCHHNHSCDCVTFYHKDGSVPDMVFCDWSSGNDLWDAMLRLRFPFKDDRGMELIDGVEYYFKAPWET